MFSQLKERLRSPIDNFLNVSQRKKDLWILATALLSIPAVIFMFIAYWKEMAGPLKPYAVYANERFVVGCSKTELTEYDGPNTIPPWELNLLVPLNCLLFLCGFLPDIVLNGTTVLAPSNMCNSNAIVTQNMSAILNKKISLECMRIHEWLPIVLACTILTALIGVSSQKIYKMLKTKIYHLLDIEEENDSSVAPMLPR